MYNGGPELPDLEGATHLGCNYYRKTPKDVEICATEILRAVNCWLKRAGSIPAYWKIKAALIMNQRILSRCKSEDIRPSLIRLSNTWGWG